jgi:nitrogen regulatory protein PII-like uncharacterized protein
MSGRWWRAYGRARHDPKLLKLTDKQFRWWFSLVCVASDNDGVLPSHADLAVEFRVTGKVMTEALDALVAAGLFDHNETGIHPHNWNGLQYKSDVSNERVKRFRERQCNVTGNVSVTPSETETEADTEQTVAKATERAPKEPQDVKFALPSDWQPSEPSRHHASDKGLDPGNVTEAFTDYFCNGRGKREKRTGPGWEKRYRVWCNTDADRKPAARGVRAASTGGDAGAFARAAARLGRD